MKKTMLFMLLLLSMQVQVQAQTIQPQGEYQKGFWVEAGKIVGAAIVGEIVSRGAKEVLDRTPTPRPERPPERHEPTPPQRGADPRPDPCPAPGNN
jgi:hypothetical protein